MSQPLPAGDFSWADNIYIVEVDLDYPKELPSLHSDSKDDSDRRHAFALL